MIETDVTLWETSLFTSNTNISKLDFKHPLLIIRYKFYLTVCITESYYWNYYYGSKQTI